MEEGDLKQDYFISDTGHINLRLKVITDDIVEREKLISDLMGMFDNGEVFELSKCAIVDQLYFHNQNPLTILESTKKQIIEDIESMFDDVIKRS